MQCQDDHDGAEQRHFDEVVASMRHYYHFFKKAIVVRMTKHFARLSPRHVDLLPGGAAGIKAKVKAYDEALRTNQRFFDRVLLHMGEAPSALTTGFHPSTVKKPAFALGTWRVPYHHANKLSGTVHALSRDWSTEGGQERAEAYAPLLASLARRLPKGSAVLVPGSGLARLACEVAGAGFKSQGNDFDLFMLFTADFMLNGIKHFPPVEGAGAEAGAAASEGAVAASHERVAVCPWVHSLCNNKSHSDALRTIHVPDTAAAVILQGSGGECKAARSARGEVTATYPTAVCSDANDLCDEARSVAAATAMGDGGEEEDACSESAATKKSKEKKKPKKSDGGWSDEAPDFSMCAGEFLMAYDSGDVGKWDGFASCFFLDTAPNPIEYLEKVHALLRPGGVWVNIGPLMYHWADQFSECNGDGEDNDGSDPRYHESVELSWEELRHAMLAVGFTVEEEATGVPCHYTLNNASFMRTQYRCVSFTARRV